MEDNINEHSLFTKAFGNFLVITDFKENKLRVSDIGRHTRKLRGVRPKFWLAQRTFSEICNWLKKADLVISFDEQEAWKVELDDEYKEYEKRQKEKPEKKK